MTNKILDDSVVFASQDLVSAELAGESVILNLKSGVYFGLDPVGARIWGLVQEEKTVNEICEALLTEYEVTPERCKRDLFDLLQQMKEHGLVEVKNGTYA